MFWTLSYTLAQILVDDTPDTPVTKTSGQPTIEGFSKGFGSYFKGESTNPRNTQVWLWLVVAVMAIALILSMYQHMKKAADPEDPRRLSWELQRLVPFPFGTRVLLWWVARKAKVNMATLLISPQAFQHSVEVWGQGSTSTFKRWGQNRLAKLRQILFASM